MQDCSWRVLSGLYQLCKEKNWFAEAAEEIAGRQLRAEVAQDKWLHREEVAERRGASAKGRSLKK